MGLSPHPDQAIPPSVASKYEVAQLQLARMSDTGGKPLRENLVRLTEIAAETLGVERVGIWLFVNDKNSVRCEMLYQSSRKTVSDGALLHAKDFPGYFRALESRRVVSVLDVEGDPISGEFRDAYFRPLGISSMLDAPIYLSGQVAGIVCSEHVGPVRIWTTMDQEFSSVVAEVVARLYEESGRLSAESALGVIRDKLSSMEKMSALGQLAAGIAHDFRNVLGAAGGYVELIEGMTPLHPKVSKWVLGLQTALEQGLALTRELTAFGTSEPAKPRVLDLRGVLERAQGILQMAIGSSVNLLIDSDPMVARVFIDPVQVERALLNLVLNARDAMTQGGTIRIFLRESMETEGGEHRSDFTVLEVGDTGKGMEDAVRRRMFEPFFTTKGEKGTGLGLAIVNQIVAQAGGFIHVDSAPGKGTRIALHLPGIGLPELRQEPGTPQSAGELRERGA